MTTKPPPAPPSPAGGRLLLGIILTELQASRASAEAAASTWQRIAWRLIPQPAQNLETPVSEIASRAVFFSSSLYATCALARQLEETLVIVIGTIPPDELGATPPERSS